MSRPEGSTSLRNRDTAIFTVERFIRSSPRVAGEIAVGLGITTRKLKNIAKTAEGKGLITDYLYRADALNKSGRQGDPASGL